MHSVGEIDIQMPRRAEHHLVALGFAAMPVAGDVVCSAVCFHFNDATCSDAAAPGSHFAMPRLDIAFSAIPSVP